MIVGRHKNLYDMKIYHTMLFEWLPLSMNVIIVFLTIFNNLSELTQSSVLDDLLGNHDAEEQKVKRYSNIIVMILMR